LLPAGLVLPAGLGRSGWDVAVGAGSGSSGGVSGSTTGVVSGAEGLLGVAVVVGVATSATGAGSPPPLPWSATTPIAMSKTAPTPESP
jgi:hypothetical protein